MSINPELNDNRALTEELRLGLQKSEYPPVDTLNRLERIEGAFAHIAEAIFVVELDGRIIEANLAASALLGYSRQELLAMHPWDFVTSASREHILNLIHEVGPETSVTVQRIYRAKSEVLKFIELRLTRYDLADRRLIIASCRDVTEQKQLEDRLRRSERNLAEGQRLTKTGSWILDFETGKTDWSVETCRIFGFPDPPPSPHYSEFRARVNPEDREGVDRGLRESFETGEPRPLKYIFILPDGTRKNIETISQPVKDEAGELRLMGTVMDVTERAKVQEALQQSEDHLRLVIDTIPGLVWSAKPDGNIDYLNKRWIEYTGLALEQACGWDWRQAIHPKDLPGLEAYWRTILAEGKAGETEARLRRFDGEFRWFLFRCVPLHDGSGNLIQWYGTNTDIDDRKRAEVKLCRSEAHLTQAQCLSRTGSFSWTPVTGEVIWSAEMYTIFGEDPKVKPTLEMARRRTHPEDLPFFETKVRSALQMGKDLEYEHRLLMADGTIKNVQVVARAGKDDLDRVEYVGAVMDVTERTRAAEALRMSEHLARGQLNALMKTLDALSHESDPDQLPRHIVNTIVGQMVAHSATIWERSDDRLELLGIVEEGRFHTRNEAGYFGGSIPVSGHAPPLWVEGLSTGLHMVIEDINKEPSRIILADGRTANWSEADLTTPFVELKRHLAAQGVRGLLIAPMLLAGDLAGIIGIRFTGSRIFAREEIELTKALANQAMLSMQLMRLSKRSRDSAVIAERFRMARDIHDTLAQSFTGMIMQLEAAKGAIVRNDLAEVSKRVEQTGGLARIGLKEARRSVLALRPHSLQDRSLAMALDSLLKRITQGSQLQAELQMEGKAQELPAEQEEALLRIAQEALTNTFKHAAAGIFRAILTFGERDIQLRLVDDGRGFNPHAEHEGFGLLGMRERVDQLGGQFTVRTQPGHGTEIQVIFSLDPGSHTERGDEHA